MSPPDDGEKHVVDLTYDVGTSGRSFVYGSATKKPPRCSFCNGEKLVVVGRNAYICRKCAEWCANRLSRIEVVGDGS